MTVLPLTYSNDLQGHTQGAEFSANYQLVVRQEGKMDEVLVRVELKEGLSPELVTRLRCGLEQAPAALGSRPADFRDSSRLRGGALWVWPQRGYSPDLSDRPLLFGEKYHLSSFLTHC